LKIIYKLNRVVEATDKSTHFGDPFEDPCNYCKNLEKKYNLNILEVKSFPYVYPDLPTLFYHIGNVNYSKQEYSIAIEHYNIISRIMSKFSFENSTLYNLDNMIGQSYKKLGKCEAALSFFNSFLNSSLKNSAHDNINAGIAYNNLGSINLIQSQNDAALKYFNDSLAEFDKKNLPVDHPYRALTYSNIGLANEKLNKIKEAITSYEKCLEIRSKYMAKNHREVTTLEEKINVMKQNSNL
jgi:tetratricopeptide (TPR) repeat protein